MVSLNFIRVSPGCWMIPTGVLMTANGNREETKNVLNREENGTRVGWCFRHCDSKVERNFRGFLYAPNAGLILVVVKVWPIDGPRSYPTNVQRLTFSRNHDVDHPTLIVIFTFWGSYVICYLIQLLTLLTLSTAVESAIKIRSCSLVLEM